MHSINKINTDVLIIGGGHASLFAAIKAKKEGAGDVVVVDKSYAGKSGQSPYTDSLCIFNADWGHDMDKWLAATALEGEYMNHPEWTKVVFDGSFEVYEQLLDFGLNMYEEDGKVVKIGDPKGGPQTIFHGKNIIPGFARKAALKAGVKIIDRVMITELVKNEAKVIGAVGICAEEANLYVFSSKVTIMCAGAVGFKPNGWPIHNLTGDADAMAYRLGNEVLGKEFIDTHESPMDTPSYMDFKNKLAPGARPHIPSPPRPGKPFALNAEGEEPQYTKHGLWLTNDFEVHEGKGPVSRGGDVITGGTTLGMACHKTEGIVPTNDLSCRTQIEGLFAAGDALGNMAAGANYPMMGFAATHAMVTGNVAGINATKYASEEPLILIDDEKIESVKKEIYAPLERKGGFSPRWVNQVLKNTLMPYFVLYIKHEERLKGALSYIEFMNNHLVPKLTATDAHELRLAHETKNMVLNAEIKLRSSIARKESRGSHYREDYPKRDDNFLAWIKLKDVDGKMDVKVDPIPKELLPDLASIPYEEKYPLRLPKEFDN